MENSSADELDANDRKAAMGQFAGNAIDAEFLPFITRINLIPFVPATHSWLVVSGATRTTCPRSAAR